MLEHSGKDNNGDTATGEPAGTSRSNTNVVISIFYSVVIQIHPNHSFWDMYTNLPPMFNIVYAREFIYPELSDLVMRELMMPAWIRYKCDQVVAVVDYALYH
eukprot:8888605-Ditylum_brightwellii.AAC.1